MHVCVYIYIYICIHIHNIIFISYVVMLYYNIIHHSYYSNYGNIATPKGSTSSTAAACGRERPRRDWPASSCAPWAQEVRERGSAPKGGRHSSIVVDPQGKLCLSSAHPRREKDGLTIRTKKWLLGAGLHLPFLSGSLAAGDKLVLVARPRPRLTLRRVSKARKGGQYSWKPSSSSNFSIRAFRAYPLIQKVPCRAIRGNSSQQYLTPS